MSERSVLTIGNFDGVHVGHQAIVRRARAMADTFGGLVKAVTFEPHPATVLPGGRQPKGILGIHEKVQFLKEAGCDRVVVIKPCEQLLAMAARDFINMLVVDHQAKGFVEGEDFRFGKGRVGDVAMLRELGKEMDFEVAVVDDQRVCLDDYLTVDVSSTFVRELIKRGRVSDARRCMGRAYAVSGEVVKGKQLGRTIGVPTVNVDLKSRADRVFVCHGVYGGYVTLADGSRKVGAISVGAKPTFEDQVETVLEAHLLDFEGDLYGQGVTVEFRKWVRGQVKFEGVDALKDQLRRDIQKVRGWEAMGVLDHPPICLGTNKS